MDPKLILSIGHHLLSEKTKSIEDLYMNNQILINAYKNQDFINYVYNLFVYKGEIIDDKSSDTSL